MILDEAPGFESRPSHPPSRPIDLDTRLSTDQHREFQALAPQAAENWSDYYGCYCVLVDSIRAELEAIDPDNEWYELLSPPRRAVILLDELEREVNNGGFDQYYLNSSGDGAALAPESLRMMGYDVFADLVQRANAQFPEGPPADRNQRLRVMDSLGPEAAKVWHGLDLEFYATTGTSTGNIGEVAHFILNHATEFFRADSK